MAKAKDGKWRTVRCIIEYRTARADFSERDLARRVQHVLDSGVRDSGNDLSESKLWAKQFTAALARTKAGRPKALASAIKKLEAAAAALRRMPS